MLNRRAIFRAALLSATFLLLKVETLHARPDLEPFQCEVPPPVGCHYEPPGCTIVCSGDLRDEVLDNGDTGHPGHPTQRLVHTGAQNPTDSGGWIYYNNAASGSKQGRVEANCTHLDKKGQAWNSF